MTEKLETDYLIIGAGAMGMAFADTLLTDTQTSGARIMMVDGHAKPGGHWNDAYPFVTLHQPASFYGVASRELSTGKIDDTGLNKGLCDLSTGSDINSYFDQVMRHTFLPSGRVQYFPMCHYTGTPGSNETFHSITSGKKYEVTVTQKTVDATFLKNSVPSTHTPNFSVGDGVTFMPLNNLPGLTSTPDGYVVIGGGKTGIDACLWLLETGVDPDAICWIVSRDAWMLDRSNTQPAPEFVLKTITTQAAQMEAISAAKDLDDMYDRLEACGYFVRLDKTVCPSMFHGATISPLELDALRTIRNVVRMGHVQNVGQHEITLERGTIPTTPNTVHVDCSATAITNKGTKPIFAGNVITPQFVRSYQPLFSASLIAHAEATLGNDEDLKNKVCGVVPLPDSNEDFVRFTFAAMMNQYTWSTMDELSAWLRGNRLDGFSRAIADIPPGNKEAQAVFKRISAAGAPAVTRLGEFLAQLDEAAA